MEKYALIILIIPCYYIRQQKLNQVVKRKNAPKFKNSSYFRYIIIHQKLECIKSWNIKCEDFSTIKNKFTQRMRE